MGDNPSRYRPEPPPSDCWCSPTLGAIKVVGGHPAGPRNKHSKALATGPTEAYSVRYVAGSALG